MLPGQFPITLTTQTTELLFDLKAWAISQCRYDETSCMAPKNCFILRIWNPGTARIKFQLQFYLTPHSQQSQSQSNVHSLLSMLICSFLTCWSINPIVFICSANLCLGFLHCQPIKSVWEFPGHYISITHFTTHRPTSHKFYHTFSVTLVCCCTSHMQIQHFSSFHTASSCVFLYDQSSYILKLNLITDSHLFTVVALCVFLYLYNSAPGIHYSRKKFICHIENACTSPGDLVLRSLRTSKTRTKVSAVHLRALLRSFKNAVNRVLTRANKLLIYRFRR